MAKIWEPQSIDVYKSWVMAITDEASDKLNDWEMQFIGSLESKLLQYQNLTQNQAEKLEQIYTKYTS